MYKKETEPQGKTETAP